MTVTVDRPPAEPEVPPRPRRRSSAVKAMIGLLVCCTVLAVGAAAVLVYGVTRLDRQLERIGGVFPTEAGRPPLPSTPEGERALNVLLLGTDLRPGEGAPRSGEWVPGLQRTDTIMLLHIDADREGASVVSIPRDSWVPIPGYGENKINAAFSYAGPSLAVQTVEDLTGVRVDHVMVVDWGGFAGLTDALGGVTVEIEKTVHDSYRNHTWTAGEHHLDGEDALLYVRQRAGLPQGDLTRVQRQQNYLRAMMEGLSDTARSKNPRRIYSVLDEVTRFVAIDEEWETGELRRLALDLRRLRTRHTRFLTVPVAGLGREGAQSVVHLDHDRARSLWRAVRDDEVESWIDANEDVETPDAVD
ncbi:LCP family protein [Nocardioides sp.]|uniref:LCP family protein n=1 Tax=Nocardioides sp. TaxID=35761 RepID=UPI002733A9E5|nr:LCP family protein [Nocardioides sp.]MDP3894012.1 LCP family protein [Nocardioides sp.]